MAFNLNKNDGTNPAGDSSKKQKFDLSKSSVETATHVQVTENKGSSKWIIISLLLLTVGVGGWYFLSKKQSNANVEEIVSVPQTTERTSSTAEPAVILTEPPVVQESKDAATVKTETASNRNINSTSSPILPVENKSTSANYISVTQTDENKNNTPKPIQSVISNKGENESSETMRKITAMLNRAALKEIQAIDIKPNRH